MLILIVPTFLDNATINSIHVISQYQREVADMILVIFDDLRTPQTDTERIDRIRSAMGHG